MSSENYIVKSGSKVFCGWDLFGEIKIREDASLAYRMSLPLANRTLEKIKAKLGEDSKVCKVG